MVRNDKIILAVIKLHTKTLKTKSLVKIPEFYVHS